MPFPGQIGREQRIFTNTFFTEKLSILIQISLTFIPKCLIDK